MFNFINNFFRSSEQQSVESSTSSDEGKQQKEQEQKKKEKKYLEQEEPDEVRIGGRPELTEEEVWSMLREYVNKLKSEHSDNEKVCKKLDKFYESFNMKKFLKNNPHLTYPDFYMVIYNETSSIVQ